MPILSKVQKGQPITAELFNNMIDAIRECQVQSVVGGTFKRTISGTTISVDPLNILQKPAQTICPFDATAKAVDSSYEISFTAGTINGVLPTNMFEKLYGVTTAQNNYFYLRCSTDGKVITESVIENDTDLRDPVQPTADSAPTEFNIMIGYMTTAGVVGKTIACGHLQARIAPSLQEDSDVYVAGARNYTQFYNWVF